MGFILPGAKTLGRQNLSSTSTLPFGYFLARSTMAAATTWHPDASAAFWQKLLFAPIVHPPIQTIASLATLDFSVLNASSTFVRSTRSDVWLRPQTNMQRLSTKGSSALVGAPPWLEMAT